MECTKCHDHKYDPLTQKDYFSLSAFFNNIDEAGLHAFMGNPTPTPALELADLPSDQKIKDAEQKLQQYLNSDELSVSFNNWKQRSTNMRLGTYSYFNQSNDQNVTTCGMLTSPTSLLTTEMETNTQTRRFQTVCQYQSPQQSLRR